MRINKKFLQLIAAVWILVFHLWMNLSGSQAEQFLIRTGYAGVDLFFFLSAYSLAGREISYGPFVKSRGLQMYMRFLLFVFLAAIYKSWSMARILKTVAFFDFFSKGGGAFLWFLPAIILLYLLYPLFLKWNFKHKTVTVCLLWFLLSLISQQVLGYSEIFIFTNRIPVILLGYLVKTYDWKLEEKGKRLLASLLSLAAGFALCFFWGYQLKLNTPIKDLYFVLALPVVFGLAGLSTFVKDAKWISLLGAATLEVYALQMIFGANLVTKVFALTQSKWLTNLLVIAILFFFSLLLQKAWTWAIKMVK